MAQELNRLDLSLPVFSHHYWLSEHISCLHIVDEYLIGELLVEYSHQMQDIAIMRLEGGCCEVVNPVVYMMIV